MNGRGIAYYLPNLMSSACYVGTRTDWTRTDYYLSSCTYVDSRKMRWCAYIDGRLLNNFRFTSDLAGGGEETRYFCRFYLAVFNVVLTDTATINKYSNNVQQLTYLTWNKSVEIKYIWILLILCPQLMCRPLTDMFSKEDGQNKEDKLLPWSLQG